MYRLKYGKKTRRNGKLASTARKKLLNSFVNFFKAVDVEIDQEVLDAWKKFRVKQKTTSVLMCMLRHDPLSCPSVTLTLLCSEVKQGW